VSRASAMSTIGPVSGPHGFNIGMNQVVVAGPASRPTCTQHVSPDGARDTTFIPIVAPPRSCPNCCPDTRRLLADSLASCLTFAFTWSVHTGTFGGACPACVCGRTIPGGIH